MRSPDSWNLSDFNISLQNNLKKRQEDIKILTETLGTPPYFVSDINYGPDSKAGIGYWPQSWGIISYRFTPNGLVVPESREEIKGEHIAQLYGLMLKNFPNGLLPSMKEEKSD